MRTMLVLLCGLLLALAVLPALAKDPKPVTPKDALKGEYAIMVKELALTEDQQTKMGEKVLAMQAALKDWDTQNKEKVTKLATDIKAAKEAKDAETVKALTKEQKELMAGKSTLQAQHRKEIMDVLTPEQKQEWAAVLLQREMLGRFRKAKLTPEQSAQIKPLCQAAIKEIAQLAADDKKGAAKVKATLVANIDQQVLTDEQRALMKAPPPPKPAKNEQGGAAKP